MFPDEIYESHPDWGTTMFLSERDMEETIDDLLNDGGFVGISLADCQRYTLVREVDKDTARYQINDREFGLLEYEFTRQDDGQFSKE